MDGMSSMMSERRLEMRLNGTRVIGESRKLVILLARNVYQIRRISAINLGYSLKSSALSLKDATAVASEKRGTDVVHA